MRYECTSCKREVELDKQQEYARNHRRRKGVRGSSWCDGSGRHKRFLRRIEVDLP